jgi:Malectin domain
VPSPTTESPCWQEERAELQAVLQSQLFMRSPALTHLLSYLCEKTFSGEADQIKEYSLALDVFDRHESFDQDTDSIVRVEANRLRKRLKDYYASQGAPHPIHITIPVGQYVPLFERVASPDLNEELRSVTALQTEPEKGKTRPSSWIVLSILAISAVTLVAVALSIFFFQKQPRSKVVTSVSPQPAAPALAAVGLPVGDEIRILAGGNHKYIDHAGKLWSPDAYFSGGTAVSSPVRHIWRTQDPTVYRNSRQGDFSYDIPLKPGVYELHLHFAETFYGPENAGAGGEGSRIMTVRANGEVLLHDFDVLADSGGARTAEVKVFPDILPAGDGQLHLSFSSAEGGGAMLSGIEILPGIRGQIRPVRIIARDVPYYSNDSHWWSSDTYFKEGQLGTSQEPALDTDDPEFYETERWGHFSYAIPVAPGKYTLTLYFIEHRAASENTGRNAPPGNSDGDHVFNVFCNGKTILANLDLHTEAGENHPLILRVKSLEPNAQGKLLLEFVPVTRYATVTAIEVVSE